MARPSPYPAELRRRAVRMVAEVRPDHETEWAEMKAVASKLGIGTAETVRQWVRRDQIDSGTQPGTKTEESAQIKALKKDAAELRRVNEILKAASRFLRGRARPRAVSKSFRSRICAGHGVVTMGWPAATHATKLRWMPVTCQVACIARD
jgi:transposase